MSLPGGPDSGASPARPTVATGIVDRGALLRLPALRWPAVLWLVTVMCAALPASAPGLSIDLPVPWLAVGPAVSLMLVARTAHTAWALALVLGLISAWHIGSPGTGAVHGGLAAAQAALAAGLARHLWRRVQDGAKPLYHLRLLRVLLLLFAVVLPVMALGAAGLLLLAAIGGDGGLSWDSASIPFRYAAATGLSIMQFVPLMWRRPELRPFQVQDAALLGLVALSCLLSIDDGMALYAVPVLLMLAGVVGGLWLVAACSVMVGGTLLAASALTELPPFEGPDGHLVLFLFVWRVTLAGYLVAAWGERHRGNPAQPGSEASVMRGPHDLARGWMRTQPVESADDSALLLVEPADRADAGLEDPTQRRPSWSSREHLLELALLLRQGDLVAPLQGSTLLLVLNGCPGPALGSVVARLQQDLSLASGRSWRMRRLAVGPAVGVVATSAAWMDLDADLQLPDGA